ncbi:MAG: hypothetical protein AAGA92_09255 [Planctomycetota bacterium]
MEGTGLDFTAEMRRLCFDVCGRLTEFSHIDMGRVAVSTSQTRRRASHGLYASLTPLRFEGGGREQTRRGRVYRVEPVLDAGGREYLYILTFYLPRFCDTSLEEKLVTVLHELWHIGPAFDGDLRRFEGRFYAHGPSQKAYDEQMRRFTQAWLALSPPEHLYEFLTQPFDGLVAEHGRVVGARVRTPRLVPVG